jgi:hypothetical protein
MKNAGVLYIDKAHTTGGRDGASRSSDGRLDIKLLSPGRPGSGTNPEQLFAAGWSAYFMGAMGLRPQKGRPASRLMRPLMTKETCATPAARTSFCATGGAAIGLCDVR